MARDDSPHSTHHEDESERARIADDNQELDETAPLLTNERGGPSQQSRHDDDDGRSIDNVSVVSVQSGVTLPEVTGKPWASTTAIIGLTVAVICVLIGVFVGPSTVEEYGKQALTIEPKGLAIDSFTRTGVKARVQADAWLDPAKVNNSAIRTIGRFGMWMAHYLESEPTDIAVYLPEYNNMTLGTAQTPGMKLNVRAHEVTHLDFVALAKPGKIVGLQEVTDDFLKGRIAKLTVQGLADVKIKWKFVPLGETELAPKVILEGRSLLKAVTKVLTAKAAKYAQSKG